MHRGGLAAIAIALALGTAPDAAACCVAYDKDYAHDRRDAIKDTVTANITSMQLAVIEALRQMTSQLSTEMEKQTAADYRKSDAQDGRAVAARYEDQRIRSVLSAMSGASTCNVVTGNKGAAGINQFMNELKAKYAGIQDNWNNGLDGPSRHGASAAAARRVEVHGAKYCDINDVHSGVCTEEQYDRIEETIRNADLNVDKSLFAAGTLSEAEDASSPPKQLEAAGMFVINAFSPLPATGFEANAAETPAGKEMLAKAQTYNARSSVSLALANHILTSRKSLTGQNVASGDGAADLKDWAEGTAQKILGYNPSGENFPNGVSWHDWMEVRSKGWYLNPEWTLAVDGANESQNLKDLALMKAYQNHLDWETYRLLEKMGLTAAAQLSTLNEINSR